MTEENKMKSRKFIVWLTWLLITVLTFIFCIVKGPADATELIEKVLGYFSGVSLLYLGANAGQKAALALAEAITPEKENA